MRGGGTTRGGATDGCSHGDDPNARGRVRRETHVRLRAIRGRVVGVAVRFRENIDCVQDASVRDARLAVRDERFAQNAQSARGGEDAPADFFLRRTTKTRARVVGRDETLVSHSETDSTVETTHPHHTTREKIWVSLRSTHTHFTTCPPDVPFAEASYRSPETPRARRGGAPAVPRSSSRFSTTPPLARHVVPEMARLNTQGRAAVLAYVLKHWPRLKDSEALVEARRARASSTRVRRRRRFQFQISPRFVRPRGGAVRVDVTVIRPHTVKAFRSREWLEVLRTCGIRSAVDANLTVVRHARRRARRRRSGAAFPTTRGRA